MRHWKPRHRVAEVIIVCLRLRHGKSWTAELRGYTIHCTLSVEIVNVCAAGCNSAYAKVS